MLTLLDAISDTDLWVCIVSNCSKHQSSSSKVSIDNLIWLSSTATEHKIGLLRLLKLLRSSNAYFSILKANWFQKYNKNESKFLFLVGNTLILSFHGNLEIQLPLMLAYEIIK